MQPGEDEVFGFVGPREEWVVWGHWEEEPRGCVALVVVNGWESVFEPWKYGWVLVTLSANGFEDAQGGELVVHLGRECWWQSPAEFEEGYTTSP